ncbi:hypothetical protein Tco_0242811 [Tanacetum coccineum]
MPLVFCQFGGKCGVGGIYPPLLPSLHSLLRIKFGLGQAVTMISPRLKKAIHGVFQSASWAVWKWRNKLINSPPEAINTIKEEDIFPSIQRLTKTWISARYSRPTSWNCWISSLCDMFAHRDCLLVSSLVQVAAKCVWVCCFWGWICSLVFGLVVLCLLLSHWSISHALIFRPDSYISHVRFWLLYLFAYGGSLVLFSPLPVWFCFWLLS